MSRPSPSWLGFFVPLLAACTSQIDDDAGVAQAGSTSSSAGTGASSGGPPGPGPGAGTSSTGGAGGATGSGGGTPGAGMTGGGGTAKTDCSTPQAAAARLRPLSESQINNSILDIFQIGGNPARGLGQGFDDVSLEQRATVAAAVASEAAANLAKWSPCAPPASGSTDACAQEIIEKIGARVYRRPLAEAERAAMKKLFDAGIKEKDFATGVDWFLTGLLQSPDFVYEIVRPDPAETPGEVRPLAPFEYASRLAHFIWDGPPDDTLQTAAANNDLADPAKRDAQMSRMMQDARFMRGVSQFYSRWLNLNGFGSAARDVVEFDQSVVTALSTSLLMSATELYKSANPNIASLFEGETYYLNDVLRRFYGVQGSGTGFTPTAMTGQARRGILTHPGMMALLARPAESFPIGRGLYLLRNILCLVIPAPPAGLDITEPPGAPEDASTRERVERHTSPAICQGCHGMINPAGFAFESFDEVGRFRAMDHGKPVDTSGVLEIQRDVDGAFAKGEELLAKLGDSQAVRACFGEKYLEFALARTQKESADACSIESINQSFVGSGDLKQLVVSVAASDSFRMRLAEGVGQ